MDIEEKYMQRAIYLAKMGAGNVSPNPMVGAVIVSSDGKIIGEGWHRKFGGPHAEVNAVNSVPESLRHLLTEATIYVTLEPCSHYGKTPPCSLLLINVGIKRVVVGSPDPFPLVSGRGIKMLQDAGIEVIEHFLQKECDNVNRRFITAHTLHRPYIQLKWAQSSNGMLAATDTQGNLSPVKFSSKLTAALMHRQRAIADAILVGTNTILIDNPSLSTRLWPGNNPKPITFKSEKLPENLRLDKKTLILLDPELSLEKNMEILYQEHKISSLMVEGGDNTLRRFLDAGLVDEIRLETSNIVVPTGLTAPAIPDNFKIVASQTFKENRISLFQCKNQGI